MKLIRELLLALETWRYVKALDADPTVTVLTHYGCPRKYPALRGRWYIGANGGNTLKGAWIASGRPPLVRRFPWVL